MKFEKADSIVSCGCCDGLLYANYSGQRYKKNCAEINTFEEKLLVQE